MKARSNVLWIVMGSALLTGPLAAETLYVAEPKLYDDFALEQLLREAEATLASLKVAESDALSSALRTLQGAQATSTQFGLQATEVPTPGVVATESATPSAVTTTSSVTPSVPSAPALPSVSLPSELGPSAIDTLEEILQLQLRVANLRLLLRGSLSDQVSLIGGELRSRTSFTFGFPITISTPPEREYRNAVAEVEVRVKIDPGCAPAGSRPGLKALLPREKTYNVAQIRNKATGIGVGVVAGVLNLGGNWIRGQSRYFVVKDQDTLAYEGASSAPDEIVFGWRFKPVLGQRKVQPGLRQVFAQLTFPVPPGAGTLGTATVTTRWREYQKKTGALGGTIAGAESTSTTFELSPLDLSPGPIALDLLDLGNGKLRSSLRSDTLFFEGTTFRLGGAAAITLDRPTDTVQLDLAPLSLVRKGLFMGVRGQRERAVAVCDDLGLVESLPPNCTPTPAVTQGVAATVAFALQQSTNAALTVGEFLCGQYAGFDIKQVVTTPVGHDHTKVEVHLDKLRPPMRPQEIPYLTVLGTKVYGLRDAPYERYDTTANVIEFIADNSTLDSATAVEVVYPLWGSDFHAVEPLTPRQKLAVTKHTIISDASDLVLVIEGRGLDNASIAIPDGATLDAYGPGYATVTVPKAKRAGLKQVVLQDAGGGVPVLVDISKASTPPATGKPSTPELLPLDPVKVGTSVHVTIRWKNEGEIRSVVHDEKPQHVASMSSNSATVQLDDSLTARPGKLLLEVEFKDGTKSTLTVQLVDQQIAIVSG